MRLRSQKCKKTADEIAQFYSNSPAAPFMIPQEAVELALSLWVVPGNQDEVTLTMKYLKSNLENLQ